MSALSGLKKDDIAKRLANARGVDPTEPSSRALRTLVATVLLLAVGYGGALGLSLCLDKQAVPKIASGLNAFALLFIMALAIERVIQPISPLLGPDSAVSKADENVPDTYAKNMLNAVTKAATDTAGDPAGANAIATAMSAAVAAFPDVNKTEAQKKATVDDDRSKTALVTWAAATGLASLTAVGLNITLLGAVLDPSSAQPPYWLDLLVTGLAVGAGTKPLNDLWTSLQATS